MHLIMKYSKKSRKTRAVAGQLYVLADYTMNVWQLLYKNADLRTYIATNNNQYHFGIAQKKFINQYFLGSMHY